MSIQKSYHTKSKTDILGKTEAKRKLTSIFSTNTKFIPQYQNKTTYLK